MFTPSSQEEANLCSLHAFKVLTKLKTSIGASPAQESQGRRFKERERTLGFRGNPKGFGLLEQILSGPWLCSDEHKLTDLAKKCCSLAQTQPCNNAHLLLVLQLAPASLQFWSPDFKGIINQIPICL